MDLFGYKFFDKEPKQELKSISKDENDGSLVVTTGDNDTNYVIGDSYGFTHSFDVDPTIVSESQLITKYREVSLVPEIEKAVDIIINEIVSTEERELVSLDLDDVDYSESVKERMIDEFEEIINLMNFNNEGFEIVKRWYVDGRLQYQVVIDNSTFKKNGIGKLTYLDPRKLKKVRVYRKEKDVRTSADTYEEASVHYIYNDSGFQNEAIGGNYNISQVTDATLKLTDDAIVQVTSGILDPTNTTILSYLHSAIRPLNQLRSLEDAAIIYRLTRAPERRIFYIDVGNLPPAKQEQVLRRQMQQYKSKIVYDVGSGKVRSDPKVSTMIEDYWLPRTSNGRATEITTLPSGELGGNVNQENYFKNNLYNALKVPITRLDPNTGFSIGRATEITRDEVEFVKFINRLRKRFSNIFLDLLKRQLSLKGIMTPYEFEKIRNKVRIEYATTNKFNELFANEILEGKLNILDRIQPYVGRYYSMEWVWREVVRFTSEEIEEEKKLMAQERKDGMYPWEMMEGPDGGMMDLGKFSTIRHISDDKPKAPAKTPEKTPQTINNTDNTNSQPKKDTIL